MTLHFTASPAGWVGKISEVTVYVADNDGAPTIAQTIVAKHIAENFVVLKTKAADYLDMFVDRFRACGNADEPWWLDEIDFREGNPNQPITYSFFFCLDGDDGGLWTVEMRAFDNEHRPFRFERLQG